MTDYEYMVLNRKLNQIRGGSRQVLGFYGDRDTAAPMYRDSVIWAECHIDTANDIQKVLDKLYEDSKREVK